jgi:Tfp pilus assembly major pilin PilA
MLNDTILIISSAATISLLVYAYRLRKNNKVTEELLNQAVVDRYLLLGKLSDALDTLEKRPIEQTDGFLKFLEESRDSAFNFIESLQESIKKFDSETKTIFETSRYKDVKEIKKAFETLKAATLPSETPNN